MNISVRFQFAMTALKLILILKKSHILYSSVLRRCVEIIKGSSLVHQVDPPPPLPVASICWFEACSWAVSHLYVVGPAWVLGVRKVIKMSPAVCVTPGYMDAAHITRQEDGFTRLMRDHLLRAGPYPSTLSSLGSINLVSCLFEE